MKNLKIAIIGGGLTGCCAIAALSRIAKQITIFDSGPHLVGEASACNEGKIHLGYTYGMDKSLNTARLMAETAAVFEKLLTRWFGSEISKVTRSTYSHYAVHKDSLLSTDEYAVYAKDVSQIVKKTFKKHNTYFGVDLNQPPIKLSPNEVFTHYDTNNISSVFKTNEINIDPETIAKIIRKNITKIPGVTVRCNTEVLSIRIQNSKYILRLLISNTQQSEESFDYVINASWRDRLRLDLFLGLQPPKNPLFRLKYFIRTRTKNLDVPTTTVVLGSFGDIVSFNDFICLSWYPSGRLEWYEGLSPRKVDSILTEEPLSTEIKKGIIKGLSTIIPGLSNIQDVESDLKGGWIYAPAIKDVGDLQSQLHQRTQIGITQSGNYFSINPGKYTCAPYFANELASEF